MAAKAKPRLSETETEALGQLLSAIERYGAAHAENRAPARAVKYALEQRAFLSSLADAIAAAARAEGSAQQVQRVVCLGGIGFSAVAARRSFPAKVKVASVQPTVSQDTAWQMLLARTVAFANGIVDIDCLVRLPSKPWDLLVVEGLDAFVVADGALEMLRAAAPLASPRARVVPAVACVKACLCAPLDFSSVARGFRGGFDLRAVCGEGQLAATVPWLMIDDDNALLEDCQLLTEPFQALTLWDTRQGSRATGAALAAVPSADEARLEVTAARGGLCTAVLYWWETAEPDGRSGPRALQWLQHPRRLQEGERVAVVASRSSTRAAFELQGGATEVPSAGLALPSPAALRHCPMLRDGVRNEAYAAAIERAVRRAQAAQGRAVVFEIGSGTGLMTMMARRAGAERVVGCEVDPHVRSLALQVAADNAMPFGGPESGFELLPLSFQAALQEPSLQGRFNVLVAELMDDCGLGERMWPFFVLARQRLLSPGAEVVPRRLTIFAVLVDVEVEPLEGVQLWPLDPFWHCSSVPGLDGIARQGGGASVDLDRHERHWRAMSNVVEVLSVDLAAVGPESVRVHELDVEFTAACDGAANGVAWFWHAELDSESALVTVPRRLCSAGHVLPAGAVHPSRHCWKQACQALGPLQVAEGQRLRLRCRHDTVAMRWELPPEAASPEALLRWWQAERGLTSEVLLEARDFVRAWLEALAAQEGRRAEVLAVWRRSWLEHSDRQQLLGILARLGDFGLHPTTANFLVPLLFGSVTSGAKAAE